MSVQTAERRPRRYVHPITETVSGFGGAVIVDSVTANTNMYYVLEYDWSSNAKSPVVAGVALFSGHGESNNEYDPAFVARVLKADAAPTEATFDNVIDMLDWLERD
jgi:hypothetical protein